MAESRNPRKAGASKRSRPEQDRKTKQLPEKATVVVDEIEDAEGIEDEPRTIEEATSQRKVKEKKAAKKANAAPKLTPAQRLAKQRDEDAAVRANGGVVKSANGKVSARDLPCLCGCGQDTITRDARFISGHDAQLRSRFLKGEQTLDSPESALIKPFYEAGEVIAGYMLEGGELQNVHNGAAA